MQQNSDILDPLQLLRNYVCSSIHMNQQNIPESNQRKITLEDKMLVFHNAEGNRTGSVIKLPLQTPTAWRNKKGDTKQSHYTLGSLWCIIQYRHLKLSEYLKQAREIGVQIMNPVEKAEIVAFFTGAK